MLSSGRTRTDGCGSLSNRGRDIEFRPMAIVSSGPCFVPRYSTWGNKLPADLAEIGPQARVQYVEKVQKLFKKGEASSVLDARTILLDGTQTAEQYMELMSQSPPSRETWGGESELYVMAIQWRVRRCAC